MKDALEFAKPHRNWDLISCAEQFYPGISDRIVLRTPHDQYQLQQTEKVAITVYFKNYLDLQISACQLSKYIPDVVHRWGKIQIRDDPETVHSAWAQRGVNEKHRDASYARVC